MHFRVGLGFVRREFLVNLDYPRMSEKRVDDQLSDDEIAQRMERGLRRALSTPPQRHGKNPKSQPPPGKPRDGKKKEVKPQTVLVEEYFSLPPLPRRGVL